MYKYLKPIILASTVVILASCNNLNEKETLSDNSWRLGWRMIENTWNENYNLAELQFDSLLLSGEQLNEGFLLAGLDLKAKQSKDDEILEILNSHASNLTPLICSRKFAEASMPCKNYPAEKIGDPVLQKEIIELYVDDQAIRGNVMHHIISKYNIDTIGLKLENDWSDPDEVNMDQITRTHLKKIILKHGFPTLKLVGRDAMSGVFLIIQHADGDPEWQKNQLPYLEKAVKNGELPKGNYALLYDRIKVNSNQAQLYGSQFKTVNKKKGIAILQETEDLENLDKRRKEMELMPIEIYKRVILTL